MQETLGMKKVQACIIAACMAAILALGMSMGIQKAYAQDSETTLPIGSSATVKVGDVTYTVKNVTSTPGVTLTGVKTTKKSVSVPATIDVTVKGVTHTYNIGKIGAQAFKNAKKCTTVTIPKGVSVLKPKAFKGSKITKVILKTTKLKKSTVKKSLKGSKVKTIKAPSGKKAAYKKIFKKANSGKKVTVK